MKDKIEEYVPYYGEPADGEIAELRAEVEHHKNKRADALEGQIKAEAEVERLKNENIKYHGVIRDYADLREEMDRLKEELKNMEQILLDVVNQACYHDGELHSDALTAYADALVFLAEKKHVEIFEITDTPFGRIVRARWWRND